MQPSTAPRGKLVVVHPDRKAQRSLQRLVGATQCPVEVVADVAALPGAIDDTTIVVVDAAFARQHSDLRERAARAWIAVPGDGTVAADAEVVTALLAGGWRHVLAHPMPILAEELLATVQKLLRRDVFGLEKYMTWGAEVRGYVLEDARDRDTAVAELAKDVVEVGPSGRIGSLVSVIADELIANALYVAPVDEAGERVRAHEPRDGARALSGRDVVTVRWATDARYLAIEVSDQWGSLDVATVGAQLADVATRAGAGLDGGMGMALAYACCNQFVVNSRPSERTEVIALLDVRYRPTELARSGSFHAFSAEPAA